MPIIEHCGRSSGTVMKEIMVRQKAEAKFAGPTFL